MLELDARTDDGPIATERGDVAPVRARVAHGTGSGRRNMLLDGEMHVVRMIATGGPLPTVLDALCRTVQEQPDVRGIAVLRPDAAGAGLAVAAAFGLPSELLQALSRAARGADPASVGGAAEPGWFDGGVRSLALTHDAPACESAPIVGAAGGVLGLVLLFRRSTSGPGGEDGHLAGRLAPLAAVAIEHARAREAWQAGETRYRHLLDSTADAILILDDDGCCVMANHSAEALTGCSREELLHMSLQALQPQKPPHEVHAALETLRLHGAIGGESRITRKDGTVVAVSYSVTRVGPNRHQMICRDVSDRERAEQDLRETERRLQLVIRASNQAVWDWDIASQRVWRSEGFQALFGYSAGDVEATLAWWETRIHPGDRPRITATVHRALQAADETVALAYRFRRHDGTYADVSERACVVRDHRGRAVRVIGTMSDVTELNRTAEIVRHEHAMVRLLEVIAVTAEETPTIEGAFQTCLDEICAHTGWPVGHVLAVEGGAASALAPTAVWHLAGGTRFARFRAALERIRYEPGVGLAGRVFRTGRPATMTGGTPGFPAADEAQASGLGAAFAFPVPVQGEVGAVVEFFGFPDSVCDASFQEAMATIGGQLGRILERRRAAAATRQLLQQVISAQEEERARLASELHDDTAQALAGLHLGLGGLQGAPNVKVARELARELQARAARALADVRLMARGLRPSALDDLGLAVALQRYGRDLGRTRGLRIEVDTGDIAERRLPADVETALYRIAQEALTNVVKHARARSASVTLARDGAVIHMAIRDDGCGFDPSAMETAGDRMGVESLEQRAALLGGRVEIETAPGRGTIVDVRIPLQGEDLSAQG